ncbi:unnamed protein product [Caenorhabditis angaria]|uniref:Uncharacterized protein n=1 Tax=Caenorhabditis angaria TaxID=860376 RepID=A0A9P1IKB9_9PELO|nr:unnamed protein product [Caenorhabditis angaria]
MSTTNEIRSNHRNYSLDLTNRIKIVDLANSPSSSSAKILSTTMSGGATVLRKQSSISQPAARQIHHHHHNILSPQALAFITIMIDETVLVPMIDLVGSSEDEDGENKNHRQTKNLRRSTLLLPSHLSNIEMIRRHSIQNGKAIMNHRTSSSLSLLSPPLMAPSPFSDITTSSRRPLVSKHSNSSMIGGEKKTKPVADIAHWKYLVF